MKVIKINGQGGYYDLGSGYLGTEPVGEYLGSPIYSAEKFLNDVEKLCFYELLPIKVEAWDLNDNIVKMEAKV